MKVIIKRECSWITDKSLNYMNDSNFRRILGFYVINTPVTRLSVRAINLYNYGWTKPWNKKYYLNKQMKSLSSNDRLIYSAKTYADMDSALEKAGVLNDFPNDASKEIIVIYNNMNNQFLSIFYHIRNALAHGRFTIQTVNDEQIVIFEDGIAESEKFKVSARMILKMNTLLSWIELIESGEREYNI